MSWDRYVADYKDASKPQFRTLPETSGESERMNKQQATNDVLC